MDSGERPPTDADDENTSGYSDRSPAIDADDTESTSVDTQRSTAQDGDSAEDDAISAEDDAIHAPEPGSTAAPSPTETEGFVQQFRTADTGPLMWVREMLSSALVVLAIGLVLFAISGVWPPMVAVESGSMEPNMEKGDLVFVTEPDRFAPDAATNDVGIVTYDEGREADYRSFGSFGSVIVFHEPGRFGPPIIHRAHFYVEEGENWYDRADESYVHGDSCQEIRNCPAPHDGFITKGDNNAEYDQVGGIASPVEESWVTGVARIRIPYLGWIRLLFTGAASLLPVTPESTLAAAGISAGAVGIRTRRSA